VAEALGAVTAARADSFSTYVALSGVLEQPPMSPATAKAGIHIRCARVISVSSL
jgi:hypothetical protein